MFHWCIFFLAQIFYLLSLFSHPLLQPLNNAHIFFQKTPDFSHVLFPGLLQPLFKNLPLPLQPCRVSAIHKINRRCNSSCKSNIPAKHCKRLAHTFSNKIFQHHTNSYKEIRLKKPPVQTSPITNISQEYL